MKFADILSLRIEDAPTVPLPPQGSYVFVVSGEVTSTARTGFDVISFPVTAVEAMDTVDFSELEHIGGVKNVRLRKEFLISQEDDTRQAEGLQNLKRFLRLHLGIGEDEAASFKTALAVAKGRRFVGEVAHRADKEDPERFYAEVRRTMAEG